MEASERELVAAARRGDTSALATLLSRSQDKALAMLRAMLGHHADAEDACQDAFLAAAGSLPSLRDDQRFAAWLMGIAWRKGKDLQRKRAREREALAGAPAPAVVTLSEVDRTELNLTIGEALRELPEQQVTIVGLRFHAGLSYNEIAETLGVPTSTVRGALYRATRSLRQRLAERRSPGS